MLNSMLLALVVCTCSQWNSSNLARNLVEEKRPMSSKRIDMSMEEMSSWVCPDTCVGCLQFLCVLLFYYFIDALTRITNPKIQRVLVELRLQSNPVLVKPSTVYLRARIMQAQQEARIGGLQSWRRLFLHRMIEPNGMPTTSSIWADSSAPTATSAAAWFLTARSTTTTHWF